MREYQTKKKTALYLPYKTVLVTVVLCQIVIELYESFWNSNLLKMMNSKITL